MLDSSTVVTHFSSGITIPTLETSSVLVAGTRYDELPIVHIKSSLNNTIMVATDHTGNIPQ